VKKSLILHITPHLPGGLARILLSTLKFSNIESSSFLHEIIITDKKHLTNHAKKMFSKYKRFLHVGKKDTFIKKKIAEADIVQVEYWNHPLVYKFMNNFNFPLTRLILCSHTNGFSRPSVITKNAINFSDIFLSATRATRKHPLFTLKKNKHRKKKLKFVTYPVDFERFGKIEPKAHKDFNISYIGTLDYSKLHKDFLEMSNNIKIPKTNIIICGDGFDKDKIINQSKKYNLKKFKFKGFVENIKDVLKTTDILGYPLNKKHYGSGEQVIIEAMYSKIPVVAFYNHAEKEIIQNNKTGILVKDKKDYIKAIKNLYLNPKKRKKIGENAHAHIIKNLSPDVCFKNLDKIYLKLMKSKKKKRVFKTTILNKKNNNKDYGAQLFIESLGNSGYEFLNSYKNCGKKINYKINETIKNSEIELKVATKGSLFQYLYFFPSDPYLNFWAGLMSLKDKNVLKKKHLSLPKTTLECFEIALNNQPKNKEFKYYLDKIR
jgi:glycosyltransferase involved in cell wall biosynthesis